MKRKNSLMLVLGVVLGALLLLMYRYNVISPSFHEIGGLVLFGLVLVHLVLNRHYVKSYFTKLGNKGAKGRVQCAVSALFALAILAITVSGIAIARTLPFSLSTHSFIYMNIHRISSYVALALLGVHIGLNWEWVAHQLKQRIPLKASIRRPLAYGALALTVVVGVYALATQSPLSGRGHGGKGAFVKGAAGAPNGSQPPSMPSGGRGPGNGQPPSQAPGNSNSTPDANSSDSSNNTSSLNESSSSSTSSYSSSQSSSNTYHGQTVCPRTGATSNCSSCHSV